MLSFIINTKNYVEVSGKKLNELAKSVYSVSSSLTGDIQISLAVPAFALEYLSKSYPAVRFLSQHLDNSNVGATTGFLVPEIAKICGAKGSLINHSEHRISQDQIQIIVRSLRSLDMTSVVCAKDDPEVEILAKFSSDFIAVEPPELIGSGVAVSKAKPEIISNSKSALERSRIGSSKTKLLCGAGIVDGIDAKRAIELGAEGILVASGVVKAKNWEEKIRELATGMLSAEKKKSD